MSPKGLQSRRSGENDRIARHGAKERAIVCLVLPMPVEGGSNLRGKSVIVRGFKVKGDKTFKNPPPCACITFPAVSVQAAPGTITAACVAENSKATSKKQQVAPSKNAGELPAELDFFKYAQGGSGKRRSAPGDGEPQKKRRRVEDVEDEDEDEDEVAEEEDVSSEAVSSVPKHRVIAKGSNVPEHVDSFLALRERYQLPSHMLANLAQNGYSHPTGIQSYGIPILLESRDLAAISPTGTGKTLSYLIPVLAALGAPASGAKSDAGSGVRAVIVAPTRELAHQIHNECLKLAHGRKWRIVLFSKATASTLADKSVRDKVDIIISTPLRLVASLQPGKFDLNNVRHLILDEADRMLDSEFFPQIEEILASCTHPTIQKAVFSATLPAGAEKVAMGMLQDPIRVVVGLKDTPLPLISQSLTYVADDPSKLPSLLTYLAQPYNPPLLIFTSSQPRATSLAEELVLNNIPNVDCLHAGLSKKEREDAVSRMRRGESWVMVSTEVMARGMDFKGVREVINYDFPTSVQSYVHRIGRTGRAGREGKAVTFFTDEDGPYLKAIANVLLQSGSQVPEWILKLPKPSKMKRKSMGKVKRPEFINPARKIGRSDAIKKRPDMHPYHGNEQKPVRRSRRLSEHQTKTYEDVDIVPRPRPRQDSKPINRGNISSTPSAEILLSDTTFKPSRSHSRRRSNGAPPRPPNAFMLFRSDFWAKEKLKETPIGTDHRDISRVAGHCWNNLGEDERAPYKQLAMERKEAHILQYPGYKYTPSTRRERVAKRKPKTSGADEEEERCRKLAAFVMGGLSHANLREAMKSSEQKPVSKDRANSPSPSLGAILFAQVHKTEKSDSESPPTRSGHSGFDKLEAIGEGSEYSPMVKKEEQEERLETLTLDSQLRPPGYNISDSPFSFPQLSTSDPLWYNPNTMDDIVDDPSLQGSSDFDFTVAYTSPFETDGIEALSSLTKEPLDPEVEESSSSHLPTHTDTYSPTISDTEMSQYFRF
ncbi:hypothetical protein DXG01_004219 [Tephrocybe rancida]|nr:hypothetical protein DXG01_004219 [Tephrocybe rancida]